MAQKETSSSYQIWDRLQQAAIIGDLDDLKAGLAQLDDIDPEKDDMATWFVPSMAERHLLSNISSSSSSSSSSNDNSNKPQKQQQNHHHPLFPLLLHRLLTLTSRHGHLPLTTHIIETYENSPQKLLPPITTPIIRGALTHKHWSTMQLFLDRGLWDVNQPLEGAGNTLPVLKEVISSEEHVAWLLARGADPLARSKRGGGGHLDIVGVAAKRLVPVGVWRLLNGNGEGGGEKGGEGKGGLLKKSDALHRVVEVGKEGFEKMQEQQQKQKQVRKGAAEGEESGGGECYWEKRLGDIMGFLIDDAGFPLGQLEYSYDEGLFEEWNGFRALGTPLHCAVKAGNKEAVRILLEKGADRYAKDTRGRTAVDLAREAEGGKEVGESSIMGLLAG